MTSTTVAALFVTALAVYQTQSAPPSSAQDVDALLRVAGKLLQDHKGDEARAGFERALAAAERLSLQPQQAAALCGISDALVERARYPEARDYALRCLELYERLSQLRGIGRANLLLNVTAEFLGNNPEAEMRARKAIAAFGSAGDRGARAAATINLLRLGSIEPAEVFALLAGALDDARAAGDRRAEASVLHSWGDKLFLDGRYEDAFEKLERARAVYEEDRSNRMELGTVFNSLGRLYRAHGRLDEALKYQVKALEIHETAGNQFTLMQSLNAVAVVNGMLGRAKESRQFYERALAIALKSASVPIQDVLRANLAVQLGDDGEFARAAMVLEEVIAHGGPYMSLRQAQLSNYRVRLGQPREALAAAERATAICGDAVSDCVLALRARARARAATGDNAAALADITDALGRIEEIRKRLVPADFFRQQFQVVQYGIYDEAIAIGLNEHKDAGALETAELARSRAFLDLLAARIGSAENQPAAQPATLNDIAASAARLHSTFVLYWVADDAVVTWVVGADGTVRSQRTNVLRSKLDELIRTTAWRELYDILIRPVRNALPTASGSLITIVPHGPLLGLSFAALQDARGRYLLEDYTLHYAPAASVFQFTSAMKRTTGRAGDWLLVADPVLPFRSKLDQPLARLPGARAEADQIARLVSGARVTKLRDAAATEASVRTAAAGKTVLHFATHAIVRDDDPFGSFLALAPAPGGAGADGVLTAQDVYGWNLQADLIVLSACRSGGGRVTGDGVATFARAFIYAGTPSLVASLWDVADQPANRLLPGFYRAWLGGQSKARALRTAQLQLLRDLRAGRIQVQTAAGLVTLAEHPILWAGFALIGEPE